MDQVGIQAVIQDLDAYLAGLKAMEAATAQLGASLTQSAASTDAATAGAAEVSAAATGAAGAIAALSGAYQESAGAAAATGAASEAAAGSVTVIGAAADQSSAALAGLGSGAGEADASLTSIGGAADEAGGKLRDTADAGEAASGGLGTAAEGAKGAAEAISALAGGALSPLVEAFSAVTGSAEAFATEGLGGLTVAAGLGAAALAGLATDAIGLVDQIVKIKDILGVTAEEASKLALRFEDVGQNADTLVRVAAQLSTVMEQAADAQSKGNELSLKARTIQDELKVSLFDETGALREQGVVLQDVLQALGNMTDKSTAARIAAEIFGSRMAGAIIPVMNDWAAATDRVAAQSARLGDGTLSLDQIQQKWHTSLTNISVDVERIGLQVLPGMTAAIEHVGSSIQAAENAAQPFVSVLQALDEHTGLVTIALEALGVMVGVNLAGKIAAFVTSMATAVTGIGAHAAAEVTDTAVTAANTVVIEGNAAALAGQGAIAAESGASVGLFSGGLAALAIPLAVAYGGVRLLGAAINDLKPATDAAKAAQEEYTGILNFGTDAQSRQEAAIRLASEASQRYADVNDGLKGKVNDVTGSILGFVGVEADSVQTTNEAKDAVALAAKAMVDAGASTEQLVAAQQVLDPALVAVWQSAVKAAGGADLAAYSMSAMAQSAVTAARGMWGVADAATAAAAAAHNFNAATADIPDNAFLHPGAPGVETSPQLTLIDAITKQYDASLTRGGGGGGSTKPIVTAVQQYIQDATDAITDAQLAVAFGPLGGKVASAFNAALNSIGKVDAKGNAVDTSALGDTLNSSIQAMIKDAETKGIPNAASFGAALMDAVGQAMTENTPEAIAKANQALSDFNAAVNTSIALTADSFAASYKTALNKADLVSAAGSGAAAIMAAGEKAFKEGGQKNIDALSAAVAGEMEAIKKLDPKEAAYLGGQFMTAINAWIADPESPAAIAKLEAVMTEVNAVVQGGVVNVQTGVATSASAIKKLAETTGLSVEEVKNNLGVLQGLGLDVINNLTKEQTAALQQLVKQYKLGYLSTQEFVTDVDNLLGPQQARARQMGVALAGEGGFATGLEEGFGTALEVTSRGIIHWVQAMEDGLKTGKALSHDQISSMFSDLEGLIGNAPIPDKMKTLAHESLLALVKEWETTGTIANDSIVKWLQGLADSILAQTQAAAGRINAVGGGGAGGTGAASGAGNSPSTGQAPKVGDHSLQSGVDVVWTGSAWMAFNLVGPPSSWGRGDPNNPSPIGVPRGWLDPNVPIPAGPPPNSNGPDLPVYDDGTLSVARSGLAIVRAGEAIIPPDLAAAYSPMIAAIMNRSLAAPQPSLPAMSAGVSREAMGHNIVVDMRGAQLTGTVGENEEMMRRVIGGVLAQQTGRGAFNAGAGMLA